MDSSFITTSWINPLKFIPVHLKFPMIPILISPVYLYFYFILLLLWFFLIGFLFFRGASFWLRILLFTFVLRCHTGSPKGKGQNPISSNSVAGVYLPAYWLDNPHIQRFLNMWHLRTPELTERLSLIFLWYELPQRDPIPIVNPIPDTVYIFRGQWGAHSYLDSLKIYKGIDCFWNRLLSLWWLVHNVMKNWRYFGSINDDCSLT